jgi:ankyrin repeat protein
MNLKDACISGDLKTVEYLFYKDDEYEYNDSAKIAFIYGCKGGHINIVKFAISKVNIEHTFNEGFNNACSHGHEDIVKLMISKGVNDWNSGLYYACEGGHMNLIHLMIEKGAHDWNLGFSGACSGGHIDIANLMIKKGAKHFNNGFCNACECNHIDIVKLIIEKQNLHNIVEWQRGFKHAYIHGNLNIVKLILSNFNANIYCLNYALENSCKYGNYKIVKYLISKGADNLDRGLTEAQLNGHKNIVKLLTRLSIAKNRRFSYSSVQNAFEKDIKMLSEIMNKDLIRYTVIYI